MKRCPTCDRTYTDPSLNFCLEDGTPLAPDAPAYDPNATIRYPSARDTIEPPPTEIYRPEPAVTPPPPRRTTPTPTPPPPPPPQQWRPGPTAPPPQKKSNAIWWILGGLIAVIVVGGGLVVLFIALALSSTDNRNLNANSRNDNRNANVTTNTNNSNVNANTNANVPTLLTDDFSQQKWGTGQSAYGRIWYSNGEYHMTSLPEKFVVMYAPSNDYNTENATVKVTARTVNGEVPSAGFGLMVHCVQTRDKKLEDYALLIFPSADEPSYEVIMHKAGVQSALVQKTTSSAIRSGSSPNQLEIRIKGAELSFYANGQLLTKVTDTANFRRGRAGLYTSDPYEVAFDDLTIEH
jgi:hypothetical protein